MRVVAELLHWSGQALFNFFRGEVLFDVVIFFRDAFGWAKEHGTPHREVDWDDQQSDTDDGETHVHDAVVRFDGIFGEEESHANRGTGVTAGADEAGGDAQRSSRNVWHDTVRCTFRRLDAN